MNLNFVDDFRFIADFKRAHVSFANSVCHVFSMDVRRRMLQVLVPIEFFPTIDVE